MIESEIRIFLQNITMQTRKKYDHQLRALELHIGQELALSNLWLQDGIPQSELRKKLGTETSTVSNMLRKLEADGIIFRKQDELDQRVFKVCLTEKGRGLEGPVKEIWRKYEQVFLRGIMPEELLFTRQILQKMQSNMHENT